MQRRNVRPVRAYSVNFDGTNDTITFGNNLGFERTDSRTIAYWVKGGMLGHPMSKQNTVGTIGFSIYHNAGLVQFGLQGTGGTLLVVSTASSYLQTNAWVPVLITYNGSSAAEGVDFYIWSNNAINSKTVTSNNLAASVITSDSMTFGARPGSAGFINAGLKNIAIWNRLLTSAEREAFFSAGVDGYLGSIASSSLLAYYNPVQADNLSTTLPAITGGFNGTCNNMTTNNKGYVYDGDSRGLAWNPRYVPNLRFYSDMDTGVVTSSGGTIVESVADQVGVIPSFGFIKNSTVGPTFLANWRNGHAAFTSNTTTNFLKSAVAGTGFTQPFFAIYVGEWRTSVNSNWRVLSKGTVAPLFWANTSSAINISAGGTDQNFLSGAPATLIAKPFVAIVIVNDGLSRLIMWYDGGEKIDVMTPATAGTSNSNAVINWGSDGTNQLWESPIAALGMGSGTPTENTIQYIMSTLSSKYKIVTSSVFNPQNIPNQKQILDTEHVTTSSGNITQYTDQSGLAAHMAPNGGSVPIVNNWRNGKAAMLPSTATMLDSTAFSYAQPYTIVMVGQWAVSDSAAATPMQSPISGAAPFFQKNTGLIRGYSGTSEQSYGPTPADLLNIPFVAVSYSNAAGTTLRIKYQDGYEYNQFIAASPGGAALTANYWGRETGTSAYWNNYLAARAVYAGVMTPQQQEYLLNGYCSYYGIVPEETPDYMSWDCDDGALPLVNDGYLGSGANLTTAGASVTFGSDGISFTGSGSANWVRTATAGTPFEWNYNTMSAGLWVNPSANTVGSYGPILSKAAQPTTWPLVATALAPLLVTTTRQLCAEVRNTVGTNFGINSGQVLPLNAWSHIGSTYDGFTLKVYFNGKLVGQIGVPISTTFGWAGHGPWIVGGNNAANSGLSEYLPGKYQKIKISPIVKPASWFESEYLAGHI